VLTRLRFERDTRPLRKASSTLLSSMGDDSRLPRANRSAFTSLQHTDKSKEACQGSAGIVIEYRERSFAGKTSCHGEARQGLTSAGEPTWANPASPLVNLMETVFYMYV